MVFELQGRSARWRELDRMSRDLIRQRAEKYMDTQRESFLGPDAARNFYKKCKSV